MVDKKFLALFLAIFLGLVSLNFVSAAINVTECGILNVSNTLYQLNQSIINPPGGDCLGIENDSIILDCQGYNITLYGADGANWSAVGTPNFNNITIKNCVFLQNFTGSAEEGEEQNVIAFINSTNSTIFNNTFGGTGFNGSGILLDGSLNANITANTINNSIGAAISLLSGSNSSVVENNNITTVLMGIIVRGSPNTNVSSNNITSSSTESIDTSMIRLEDSDNSIVDYNIITASDEGASGIAMEDVRDVIINLNTITTSGERASGINLNVSYDTNITSNNITTNNTESDGIYSTTSNSTFIFNNTITTTGNFSDGIYTFDSAFNTITNNTLNTTNGYGIYVGGSIVAYYNHTIENNTEQGETILYLFNNDSGIVEDQTLGQLIVTNSTSITIDNVTVDYDGLTFAFTNYSIINNSNFTTSANRIQGIDFFESSHNNVTNCWVKTLIGDESCVIYSDYSDYNIFYNNVFNTSSSGELSSGFCWVEPALPTYNTWNTTEASGTNIIGGPNLGGNFWTNSLGTGFSDTCTDKDGDYICDDAYTNIATSNFDYLPLSMNTNAAFECATLGTENKTYYLNQSISSSGTCFNITANGITLNFEGYNITGDGTGYGINVSANDTTIFGGEIKGFISNFSNGIYISSGSNNDLSYFYVNNSAQDAILLEGATSDNNNFTGIIVTNTNASHYDINFSTADIDGTWIIDISGFENYTFTGAGGLVNFKELGYGEIVFLEAINGSGTSLHIDVDIENNSIFVNGSKSGLNKSANITLYDISYTDPKPQYSSDGSTYTDCISTSDPACVELSYSASTDIYVFNVSHFTYFKAAEGSTTAEEETTDEGGTTTTFFWTAGTHAITEDQFNEGFTKEFAAKSRVRISIDSVYHYVGVVSLTDTTATINVSSTSQQATLSIGDLRKFEVTNDSYYDLSVALNSINSTTNKADITIKSISEEITPETIAEEEEKEEAAKGEEEEGEKNLTWLWIIIGVIVLAAIIGGGIAVKKKKK